MSLAVLGIAGWLIYRQFETPAPIATVPLTPSPTPIQPPASESVTVQLPLQEVATLAEEIATISAQPNSPEPFNPDKLQKIALGLVMKTDTDRDGLTDDEEILMGLNPLLIDTDKDGYLDGDEVKNFYSPLAVGKVTIDQMRFAGQYTNDKYGYKIIYPAAWVLAPLDVADPSEVMITSSKNEFVNILVEKKSAGQSIEEWYRAMAPTAAVTPLRKYTTFNKLEAFESPDGFTTYIAYGNDVIVINYNIGLKTEVSYPEIYQLIVNSLQFVEASPQTP